MHIALSQKNVRNCGWHKIVGVIKAVQFFLTSIYYDVIANIKHS